MFALPGFNLASESFLCPLLPLQCECLPCAVIPLDYVALQEFIAKSLP